MSKEENARCAEPLASEGVEGVVCDTRAWSGKYFCV